MKKEIIEGEEVMKTLNHMLSEQLKNDEFRREYEAIQPEMDVIRAIVDARTSQNLTQKELAERTGINQADISKLENGTRNPSVNLLKRLAEGMGMTLKIEFVPKQRG
jgi:ribosome-binding protein aMBF1 (putative translation factor)